MKNLYNFLMVAAIMIFVIGCNCSFGDWIPSQPSQPSQPNQPNQPNQPASSPNENKSLADKATDVVTTGEKIGIQECDDLMDSFRAKIENENTDFTTKFILKALEDQFRQQIKQSLEQNNADRDATAALCKELKKSFDQQNAQPAK
jgi:hypothetical protein